VEVCRAASVASNLPVCYCQSHFESVVFVCLFVCYTVQYLLYDMPQWVASHHKSCENVSALSKSYVHGSAVHALHGWMP
jgi:hypothetical protein